MNGRKILVVDDDQQIRDMLNEALYESGAIVKTAETGMAGLEMMSKEPFDLLVFDVHLPTMSGIELLKASQKLPHKTPVIMMSGMATPGTKSIACSLGGVAFLDKPFVVAKFLEVAREALKAEGVGRRGRSILVADDHAETLDFLQALLDLAGYDVTYAPDGDQAMVKLGEASSFFDFAILDLHMPGLSGAALIEAVSKKSPKTLIILMTGEADTHEITNAYHKGGATLIRKPFRPDVLVSAMINLEHQADMQKEDGEKKEAYNRLPAAMKAVEKTKEFIKSPSHSRPKRIAKTVLIFVIAIIASVAILRLLGYAESALMNGTGRIDSFFGRMEGYLERDEQREVNK
jgi:DNA-binding NtrC family response regulator